MMDVLSRPRIILLLVAILFAAMVVTTEQVGPLNTGIKYGLEFTGGTYYQIQLEDKVTREQMELITSIIGQRVDAFGLKDTYVNALGPDLVGVQISETDPEKLAQIEAIIKTQAKFESMLEGTTLFRGSDIKDRPTDPAKGYGIYQTDTDYEWRLPLILSQKSAEVFSKAIFHKCTTIGVNQYDCADTYFFIDRPADAVVLIPSDVYAKDTTTLAAGNQEESLPVGLSVETLMSNAGVPFITYSGTTLDSNVLDSIGAFNKTKVIVHDSAPDSIRSQLESAGYKVGAISSTNEALPWVWSAIGARQAIALTPGIAGFDPYIDNVADAPIHSFIYITGRAPTAAGAQAELKNLEILLRTGSLPIGIKGFSKETISPLLGKEFLSTSLMIGVAALVLVGIVLFARYRKFTIALPIIFFGMIELLLTTGFVSFLGINIDLSAVAGLIAAIGTGLNDQIVIVDELLKGGSAESETTYKNRVRKAFFIIVAAAATIVASLSPIVLFANSGFGKLAGFALAEIIGVFTGILITRPAFAIIAERIMKKHHEHLDKQ